ncbi:hypothetical protein QBC46DRAFT_429337 [Diplogelasinospora grovesii]|uniref:Uncharacterized protein n=1 Tax=Diplogelasinospora grovesii TaxID=303347 RepID=A0AAN6MY64_9PEZI|nr:hypothetical protein QBC46DRAFT_429337 [Diplogelasinospora grovesii]
MGMLREMVLAPDDVIPARGPDFQRGARLAKKRVASEKNLEHLQRLAVEDPVRVIVDRLVEEDSVRREFDLGDGARFENHPHALDDDSAEVQASLARNRPPKTPAQARLNLYQQRPNQICVYKHNDQGLEEQPDSIAYIIEYKAPHKLTLPQLRVGLRPMDIYKEVVNQATVPPDQDLEGLFAYHADRLVAAAVTQTFHYIVEAGLDYSCLTTGEGIVFLYLDWGSNPVTLYGHLASPASEVQAHAQNVASCAAAGQVLAFTLMALSQMREHSQQERERVVKSLKTWAVDWEQILLDIPSTARKAPPDSAGYRATTYSGVDRTPYNLRERKNRKKKEKTPAAEMDDFGHGNSRTPEPSDDDDDDDGNQPGAQQPETPCPIEPRNRGRGRGQGRGQGAAVATDAHHSYCTQRCLLGLVRGGLLDERCPNVALHRPSPSYTRHPIDHATFLRLLRQQFQQTLDDGLARLGKGGARGVLFRVTLLTHGYTFVGKGTVCAPLCRTLSTRRPYTAGLQPVQGRLRARLPLAPSTCATSGAPTTNGLKIQIIYMMLLAWVRHRHGHGRRRQAPWSTPPPPGCCRRRRGLSGIPLVTLRPILKG